MGIWIELGIFGVALAFGLWQLHDVKKARAQTQRLRALQPRSADEDSGPGGQAPGQATASGAAPAAPLAGPASASGSETPAADRGRA